MTASSALERVRGTSKELLLSPLDEVASLRPTASAFSPTTMNWEAGKGAAQRPVMLWPPMAGVLVRPSGPPIVENINNSDNDNNCSSSDSNNVSCGNDAD